MSQCDSSSDINEYLPTVSADTAESPPTPTSISSGSIDTALLSDLDPSEINTRSISLHTWDSPVELTSTKSLQLAMPGSFTLHKRFFFEDGNITFLVDSILYRVHRYFFCRDSNEFVTRLSRLPAQEQASPPVVSLENVKSKDFDAFLSILYPLDFNPTEERSFEELSSILDLSTRWAFTSIREMAIRCLKPPTPLQRLILGRKYAIEQWILPALQELCERPLPLAPDEARLLNIEDVALVGSVRESIRSHTLTVAPVGIMDCIEALRNGEPWPRRPSVPVGLRLGLAAHRPTPAPGSAFDPRS